MTTARISLVMMLGAGLALLGCNGDDGETDAGAATFTQVMDGVITPTCALAGCHGEPSAEVLYTPDLAYANLVDAASEDATGETLVIPGDADNSYLVKKIEGEATIVGDPMPPPFGGLDPADVQLIRDWIADGAPDN